jgi:thiosulfate/3-mercaptopyruvate sulfurtransferase
MAFTTLVDTADVAAHLDDANVVIVDCRYKLSDESWGANQYLASHVPGAVYAHLDSDLSGKTTGRNGRHPLPSAEMLARTFGRLGISNRSQIIAYDQDDGTFASRLWWLAKWIGHDAVAVLNGGFAKWLAEGRPTRSGQEAREPAMFRGALRQAMAVDVDEVARESRRGGVLLVDARAPERYRGELEPIDRVAGHIPGAVNHHFKRNLEGGGRFRSSRELREQFLDTLGGAPPEQVICYCGSGVTACHNLLALEHAGLHGARLYAGSWSEWTSDPERPVERGRQPNQ